MVCIYEYFYANIFVLHHNLNVVCIEYYYNKIKCFLYTDCLQSLFL